MSKIDELINQLCPNGVTYYELRELFKISRGRVMSKEYLRDNAGNYPVYSSQTANNGQIGKIATFDFDGEYLTWTTDGANAGTIFYRNGKFSITNVCGLLKATSNKIDPKFAYYILSVNMKNYVSSGMGNPKLMSNVVEKIKIPIPPIAIQEEIVNILDTFTTLEAELEAELEARKKQYTFYRDSLLSFEGKDVEWKKIKQVFRRIKGTSITATKMKEIQNDDGEIRVFAGGKTVVSAREIDIPNANITRVPSVLVQSRGVIDFVYFDKPFTFKNEMWAYTIDNKTTVKYLYYYLKNSTQYFRDAASGMGALPQISLPVTEDFVIPIPSISEQERIVEILEKFDVLVNDISTGLPAEIEFRRKQYEYYRNQLLTFNRASNE